MLLFKQLGLLLTLSLTLLCATAAHGHDTLWAHTRAGMQLVPAAQHQRIDYWIKHYQKNQYGFKKILSRAERYLYYLTVEAESRGLPTELALLPAVESGFDPFAHSPSKAAGLWQFIPGTAKRFKLKNNWWYDGRRDVLDSTRAAFEYLRYLVARYRGDWLLALAAYNTGEGNIDRALKKNRNLGLKQDFWHIEIAQETRSYVPRLLALAELIRQPDKYHITLPKLADQPYFAIMLLPGQIDIDLAAKLADVSLEEMLYLNPGFNRWATTPTGPHRILIPAAQAKRFSTQLAATPTNKLVSWRQHQVQAGDVLSKIAAKYEIKTSLLRDLNQLSSNIIKPGQKLLIPPNKRRLENFPTAVAERVKKWKTRAAKYAKQTYTVRPGDTLSLIAQIYGVKTAELRRWNKMGNSSRIKAGQKLAIHRSKVKSQQIKYRVREGQTLSHIASQFQVSIKDLCRWNGITNKKQINAGQIITVHVRRKKTGRRS